MVEKEGADATFCGGGRRMDGAENFFTELENFFRSGRKKAPVFLSGNSKINLKRAENYVILCKSP